MSNIPDPLTGFTRILGWDLGRVEWSGVVGWWSGEGVVGGWGGGGWGGGTVALWGGGPRLDRYQPVDSTGCSNGAQTVFKRCSHSSCAVGHRVYEQWSQGGVQTFEHLLKEGVLTVRVNGV